MQQRQVAAAGAVASQVTAQVLRPQFVGRDVRAFGDPVEFLRFDRQCRAGRVGDGRESLGGDAPRPAHVRAPPAIGVGTLRLDERCVLGPERPHDIGAGAAQHGPSHPGDRIAPFDDDAHDTVPASRGNPVAYARIDSPMAAMASSTGALRSSSIPRQFAQTA